MRLWTLLIVLVIGCSPEPPPLGPVVSDAVKLDLPGIENVYRVTPTLYSGGAPEGDDAFAELKKLGVRTVISVDGLTPDVAAAERAGITTVHLPIGYDGIPSATAYRLAKAVQTLPGPVYLHCHHGKHRGPAAVAAVRLCLEPGFTPAQAGAWFKQAGTDPAYTGLTRLPLMLPRPTAEQLEAIPTDFPTASPVADLTKAMVTIDQHFEALKAAKARDWLGAETAATLLADDYREAKRMLKANARGEPFRKLMGEAEAEAKEIVNFVKAGNYKDADAAFAKSQALCIHCHNHYRN